MSSMFVGYDTRSKYTTQATTRWWWVVWLNWWRSDMELGGSSRKNIWFSSILWRWWRIGDRDDNLCLRCIDRCTFASVVYEANTGSLCHEVVWLKLVLLVIMLHGEAFSESCGFCINFLVNERIIDGWASTFFKWIADELLNNCMQIHMYLPFPRPIKFCKFVT